MQSTEDLQIWPYIIRDRETEQVCILRFEMRSVYSVPLNWPISVEPKVSQAKFKLNEEMETKERISELLQYSSETALVRVWNKPKYSWLWMNLNLILWPPMDY